jgi:hypothetical protein
MTRLYTFALALLLAACGASTGFHQAAPRAVDSSKPVVTNNDQVEDAFELQAQLPKPYRLGVVFRDPVADQGVEQTWRWEAEHRAQLLAALETLEGKGEISAVFSIARSTVVADNLHAIRVAAARQGADAVLVISAADLEKREANAWAFSYLALVPMLFAPGNELRVDFTTHAELWDVRNEYLYLAAEAEARAEQQRALPYIDLEEASADAQKESLELLVKELTKRFTRLHGPAAG